MKERHLKILDIVNEKERISVQELSEKLGLSVVTIRKDLEELETEGLLRRQHGYAAKASPDAINSRMSFRYLEKKKIAQRAVSLVEPMETIMIESGSTCALFAAELAAVKDVTIITNSTYIARSLGTAPGAKVILLGGDYDMVAEVTTGPVGIDGYTEENGFSNINHTRCSTVRALAKQADKVIVLTTSDKFGKRSVAKMFSSNEVHTIVTDSLLAPEYADILRSHQIRVELA